MSDPTTTSRKRKTHRGKCSDRKYKQSRHDMYVQRSIDRRSRDIEVRCPEGDEGCRVVPYLHSMSSTGSVDVCPDVIEFYKYHGTCNRWVVVSNGISIANKNGIGTEKSLVAKVDIPVDTRVCPYSGELYEGEPRTGRYRMRLSNNSYIDAEYDTHDVGYLYCNSISTSGTNPFNYGRYCNTVYKKDRKLGYELNCRFELDESGYDVVWIVTTAPIAVGQELLVDYSGLH